jgi:hypothetical protein
MENSEFLEIGLLYQKTLEASVINFPFGTCYLAGYCLSEYFKSIGYESRSVTGNLALIDKNGRYYLYGNLNIPKSKRIGVYHTWCEIFINNEWYILDPTLKYNNVALKSLGAKLNSKIPDILFTKDKNSFAWKYIENENLAKESDQYLEKASNTVKNGIIQALEKR